MRHQLLIFILILYGSQLWAQDVVCPTILNPNPNNSVNTSVIIFFDNNNEIIDTCICTKAGMGAGTEGQYNCGSCLPSEWSYAMIDGEGPCFNEFVFPVELSSIIYHISSDYNELKWVTKTESNNDYFTVEHSIDGLIFNQIAIIAGAGNSNVIQYYNYTHYFTENLINYYRIVQVDYDGQYKMLVIISIDNSKSKNKLLKTLNLLGQEVGDEYSGLVIDYYSDGSNIKVIR